MMMEIESMPHSAPSQQEDHGVSIPTTCKRPVILQFENLVYKIKNKDKETKKTSKNNGWKTILKEISGEVLPGEMLAMMGPSGSGKTTLLTTLAGRQSTSSIVTGTITYNNSPFSSSLNRLTGFVAQDDVLYPHLTVFETLLYTALLRLPKSINEQLKISHVETIITQLGLVTCRDSIIGDHYLRGISGGERKRVSIGQEVLIDPSLLFLDEPTSGLDSTTAQRIVSVIGELANRGKTVVMTIHQPSSSLFYMFHKVLLLSDGYPLYFGKQSEVMSYFSSIGYSPSVAMNPADFLLDLTNGIVMGQLQGNEVDVKEELVSGYNVHLKEKIKEEIRGKSEEKRVEDKKGMKSNYQKWNTSWWDQFTVLIRRDLKERRHEAFSSFAVSQVLITSFICGALWWKSKSLQDQTGLLFSVTGFWGSFPLFQAVFKFPQERLMLMKERSSGMYRLSSYFMARMVVDLPMELILPTVSIAIVYWMGGLKPMPTNFFICLSITFLSVLVTQGVGFAIGAAVMDFKVATMLASVLMLTFLLVGGFFVQHVPIFIAWIKYISYIYYSFKLLLGSQYERNETYECGNKMMRCRVDEIPIIKVAGLDHQGLALGVMLFMFMLYRLVAYVALMRVGVAK